MKRKKGIGLLISFIAITCMVSCSKTSEDILAGSNANTCDTTTVSYSLKVVPILVANCYRCHGNGNTGGSGGILLEVYTNILKWANNGYLVGNVTHNPDPKYVPMPYGGAKLPDCEVNTIVAWVNQGAQNN